MSDTIYALLWGAAVLLAGLFFTRGARPHFPVLAVAAAGLEPNPPPPLPEYGARRAWPAPLALPSSRPTGGSAMPEVPEDLDEEAPLGDVVHTTEQPILAPPDLRPVTVTVNIGLAYEPEGNRAIHVAMPPDGLLTAAQAHRLQVHLTAAHAAVAGIRQDAGFES